MLFKFLVIYLPCDLSCGSARIISKVIEKMAATIRTLSMKSSRAPMKREHHDFAFKGALKLFPNCSDLFSKSSPSSPVFMSTPNFLQIVSMPKYRGNLTKDVTYHRALLRLRFPHQMFEFSIYLQGYIVVYELKYNDFTRATY